MASSLSPPPHTQLLLTEGARRSLPIRHRPCWAKLTGRPPAATVPPGGLSTLGDSFENIFLPGFRGLRGSLEVPLGKYSKLTGLVLCPSLAHNMYSDYTNE